MPKERLTPLQRLILARQYDAVLHEFVQTDEMNEMQDKAYSRKEGYSVGKIGADKILFVSGSRNLTDWAFNALDDIVPTRAQFVSNRTAKLLKRHFDRNKCTVAVGHSRGGALVAKMNLPDYQKLGLDAAMRLAPADKRGMMNLFQKQLLDRFISERGTNQKSYKMNSAGKYHFLSRDYDKAAKKPDTFSWKRYPRGGGRGWKR